MSAQWWKATSNATWLLTGVCLQVVRDLIWTTTTQRAKVSSSGCSVRLMPTSWLMGWDVWLNEAVVGWWGSFSPCGQGLMSLPRLATVFGVQCCCNTNPKKNFIHGDCKWAISGISPFVILYLELRDRTCALLDGNFLYPHFWPFESLLKQWHCFQILWISEHRSCEEEITIYIRLLFNLLPMKMHFRLKLVFWSLERTKQMVFKISLLMSPLNCAF